MEGYASRGVAIGDSARNANAAQQVERAERMLEELTRRLCERNQALVAYVNSLECFIDRTFPPQATTPEVGKPVGSQAHPAHLTQISMALEHTGELLSRLSDCVNQIERLG